MAGAVFIAASGRWRPLASQLLDPGSLVIGLLLGVPLYLAGLALVRGAAGLRSVARTGWRPATPVRLRRAAELGLRALWEEALWRGTLQVVLGGGVAAIGSTAVLFSLRHQYLLWISHRTRGGRLPLEFFAFSLVLGVHYALSERLLLVVGLHWARNLLIDAGCGRRRPAQAA